MKGKLVQEDQMFRRIKIQSPTHDVRYVGLKDNRIKEKVTKLKNLYIDNAKHTNDNVVMLNPKHMIYGLSDRRAS